MASLRLVNLHPNWVGAGGEGISDKYGNPVPERHGVGVTFDCPCGCGTNCYVPFANPLDGQPPHDTRPNLPTWQRTGETFESLTLTPSIRRVGGCGWHGFITNGEALTA
jgi:hypothetical protein